MLLNTVIDSSAISKYDSAMFWLGAVISIPCFCFMHQLIEAIIFPPDNICEFFDVEKVKHVEGVY